MDLHHQKGHRLSMIVVMGATGAGKSYFINKLAGPGKQVTKEGDSLHSCTQGCLPIPLKIGGTTILVIDTPGFDDAKRTDAEILTEIARILVAQYKLGVELKGIIYIHRITDVRFKRSAAKTLNIFQRICGEGSLKNVLLTTSGWTDKDLDVCSRREGELIDDFWACMVDKGSRMSRFYGDHESATMIVSQLLMKKPTVLKMQRELIDDGMELKSTTAGAYLYDELELLKGEHQNMLVQLERLKHAQAGPEGIKRIETRLDTEMRKLQQARRQQTDLDRRVDDEVEEEVQRQSRRRNFLKVVPVMIPFLTFVLNVLFGLLGIQIGPSI
ncbi:Ribosome-recycling factor (Fragment) [Madurella fahalii]|uniref:Ribosome-recycling factor n=1 Tax=Madurella fahalii TaxID=1157608 RepID=A0ABQ0GDD7_9PEZI